MSWQRVRGHDALIAAFDRAVRRGRLAHAYLFAGPPGVGKRLFALELAKAILCENPPPHPTLSPSGGEGRVRGKLEACDRCAACSQVEAGTHPDFFATGRPERVPKREADDAPEHSLVEAHRPYPIVRGVGSMEPNENLGTRIVLENDLVRVWEHRVAPGATGSLHLHRRPYFSVVIQGSKGDTLGPDGQVLDHFELTPGSVFWFGEEHLPETHALSNISDDEIILAQP